MTKWYKTTYVNRRDWILENFDCFGFGPQEGLLCLVIDYLNANNIDISYDILCNKTGMKKDEVDSIISVLVAKRYLELKILNNAIKFNLDGLFDTEVKKTKVATNNKVFELFESEFARPLSPTEMEKLIDLVSYYDTKMILYALKYASMYKKLSMAYIEAILKDFKEKGITIKKLDEGYYAEVK